MLNSRRPHFLMIFHPNVCSDRLLISSLFLIVTSSCEKHLISFTSVFKKVPEKFIKHLEGEICGSVLLCGPSGNSWNVKLSNHGDELFLDDGWGMFVDDHSIESGDSFVFRYDGNLHFSVQIFDQTSCEKEGAFNAKHSGRERETGKEFMPYNVAYLGNKRKTRSTYSPSFLESEIASKKSKMEHGNDSLQSIKEKICIASRKAITTTMSSQETPQRENCARQRKPKAIKEKNSTLSTFIEQRASEHFVSEFPYFVRVMKASNVSGSGTLKPVQFSMKHLPNCRTNIVVQNLKGDSWSLTSVPTVRVQTMHTLCGGWTGFVRDNNIKFEDICIFELVGDCKMRVRIGGFKMEGLDWDNLKGSIKSVVESESNVQKPTDGASQAESFTSPFPYFTKVMMISNISGPYTMNIPSKFATEHFPSCRIEIVLHNMKGESWIVNSYPSSVRCTAHTLCAGWMSFVRENNIKLGDTCVFELVGKDELQVHILNK